MGDRERDRLLFKTHNTLVKQKGKKNTHKRGKMADSLAKYGLYIDDLFKIRILEPDVANQTVKLKDECHNFVSSKLLYKTT